jgi:class 3 adenylate cyclase
LEPEIRYATTEDGANIAFWSYGSGPTLVQCPLIPYSHIDREWRNPYVRRWYESLGHSVTVVRYDGRGNGHSTRSTDDTGVEAHYRDLDAVVRHAGPDPVALMGVFHSGPAAILYAARNPERVSHLILWCTYASGGDYWHAVTAEGLRALRQTDYEMFLRTGAHELLGWANGEESEAFAALMRDAVTPEMADRLIDSTHGFDTEAALAEIECPALVLHRSELHWLDIELSRTLAARLPDGRLAVVPGNSPYPAAGDIEPAIQVIGAFLGRDATLQGRGEGAFRAVLFTDLVDHSQMIAGLGDEKGREMLRQHERLTRELLDHHDGTEIKTLGDGFMASFATVSQGLRCAIALQQRFQDWNRERAGAPGLSVRVGLNAGEPIEEDGDLFGSSVILAARIAASAIGGEILVSNAVRDLVVGKGFAFLESHEIEAKGFDEPVRVWRVDWRQGTETSPEFHHA